MGSRGVPIFYYTPGMRVQGATFTRASTATYFGRDGIMRTAAINEQRDAHYRDGVLKYLHEPAATNIALQSESLNVAPWSASNITVTTNGATAPDGNVTAEIIAHTTTANAQITEVQAGITSGTIYVLSIFAKANSLGNQIGIRIQNPYPTRMDAVFDLAKGTIKGTNANGWTSVSARMENWGNGWYRCILMGTASSTASGNILIAPTDASLSVGSFEGTTAVLADAQVWGVQLETNILTSYIPTTTVSVTRAADVFAFPISLIDVLPQDMSIYVKGTHLGQNTGNVRLVEIGGNIPNTAGTVAYIVNYSGTAALQTAMKDGSGAFNTPPSFFSIISAVGDSFEVLGLYDTTVPATRYRFSLNGKPDVLSTYGATAQAFSAFNVGTIRIGDAAAGSTVINFEYEKIVIVVGLYDMAAMRGATPQSVGGSFTGGFFLAERGHLAPPKPPQKPKQTPEQLRAIELQRRVAERQAELKAAMDRRTAQAQRLWDTRRVKEEPTQALPAPVKRESGPLSRTVPTAVKRNSGPKVLNLPQAVKRRK